MSLLGRIRQKLGYYYYWRVYHGIESVFPGHPIRVLRHPEHAHELRIECTDRPLVLRLRLEIGGFRVERRKADRWYGEGCFAKPQNAIYRILALLAEAYRAPEASMTEGSAASLFLDGREIQARLNFGMQWVSEKHRSGWRYAIDSLRPLDDPQSQVLLDGFIESTFCWNEGHQGYRQPWLGFLHNPPELPLHCGNGKSSNQQLLALPEFQSSLQHCLGIYCLSKYHRDWLSSRISVPVHALIHPTETPECRFSLDRFRHNPRPRLVQVGYWLRQNLSLGQLQLKQLTATILDPGFPSHERPDHRVEVLPFLNNQDYDELLSQNLVFLHLIDSSANNTIVECIVRNTPLLVNPLPAVREYLGEDYPLYFRDLEEAARLAEDEDRITRAHCYLRDLPKFQFSRDYFLKSFVQSPAYQRLLPAEQKRFLIFSHPRTGSTSLRQVIQQACPGKVSHEPFNEQRGNWGKHNYHQEVRSYQSLDRCLNSILLRNQGFKHLHYQLPRDYNLYLLASDLKRVFLVRRNLLQSVVSDIIANQARHWSNSREVLELHAYKPISVDTVRRRIQALSDEVEAYRNFLVRFGLEFCEVAFEDLFAPDRSDHERQAELTRILRFLDIPLPGDWEPMLATIRPDVSQLQGAELYRKVPNIEEIEAALGGDTWGCLFQPTVRATGS